MMNIEKLKPHFRGEILTPGSAGYDSARQIWNGMIDRRPALIARCSGPADVVAAVRFAGENGVYPAIRAGGHNVAGLAMVDEGLVIDVTPMKGISVDRRSLTATAQTGHTWGSFDRETQLHGLATTGGLISTTGIAGLTLGGGIGWLMGRCGLVCDNTISYDVVTAGGTIVTASAEENPDLFWALKGGGGNFGVVTSITYRLYPITQVLSGMLVYPRAMASEVLRRFRDFCQAGLPDELILYCGVVTTPDGFPAIVLIPCYCGSDRAEGERLLAPLRAFGPPVADMIAWMPYLALQQMLDAAAPYGIRSYWKSSYLSGLPGDAIDALAAATAAVSSPRSLVMIEHAHGRATAPAPDATAFAARNHAFDLVILSLWSDPNEDALHTEWTRNTYKAMQPWAAGSVYVNALGEDESGRTAEAYGPNFARLRQVKARFDPDNRFRRNQNIQP